MLETISYYQFAIGRSDLYTHSVQESALGKSRFGHQFAIGRSDLCSLKKLPRGGVFSKEPQTYAPDLKNQVGTFSDVII
jgi:hypothetical protein